LSREKAWDSVVSDVDSDGHFEARGLPLGETFTISVPRDYEIRAVSPGFTFDELNRSLTGSLTTDPSDLKVDLVWKDENTKEKERFEARIREQFADFLESAKLTPEQTAAFFSVKRDAMNVFSDVQKQDEIPPGILLDEFENRELTKRLGEEYRALYQRCETLRGGRDYLVYIIRAHDGAWLDDEEKKRLAPLVAVELEKTGRYWTEHYWTKASQQEKIEVTKRMFDGISAACANALPPPKLEILRECLDVCLRRELESIRKETEDQ
jgi:hypothetical protein